MERILSSITPGKSSEADVIRVLDKIGLKGEQLVRELLSAELLLINAVEVIAENYLPLKYLWNWTQNRKRRTRKSVHEIYETNILVTLAL